MPDKAFGGRLRPVGNFLFLVGFVLLPSSACGTMKGEPGEWDEHAQLSPLHDASVWISSTPHGTQDTQPYGEWLRSDLWLMNVDGTGKRRTTSFNDDEPAIVADNAWDLAAVGNQQLVISVLLLDQNEIQIKIIEFAISGGFTRIPRFSYPWNLCPTTGVLGNG